MKILKLEILKPVYAGPNGENGFNPGVLLRYRSVITAQAKDGAILNLHTDCEISYYEKAKICGSYPDLVRWLTAELSYEAELALDEYELKKSL